MSNLTRNAIKSAFMELLESMPLSKITVKMIVEKCGINRNSFYYHYEDLPALVEELVMEAADQIIENYLSIDTLETVLNAVLDFASQNKTAIYHIYNSINRDIFEQYLWKVCDFVVSSYGDSILKDTGISSGDRQIIERFYRCECFGIAMEWLNNGMPSEVHEELARFCQLHQGMEREMISRSLSQE